MTISHHETFNETCNNIFPSKETEEKLTLVSTWQYGAWVLGSWRSPSSSCQSYVGSYFLPWKERKEDPLEEEVILLQRMGFTKNGWVMKMLKTQGSKGILIEMDKGRLRSLEKCFLWEEMVRWRRKIKGKKKVNSANGGREVDGGWAKKEKGKRQASRGPKFRPPHLKLSQS